MNLNLITKSALKEVSKAKSEIADAKKEEALAIFNNLPMPREKDEDWRYTEIEKLKLENFAPFESNASIAATDIREDLARHGVILTDITTALDKYPAAINYFLRNAKADKDKFTALNAAYFAHGYFLYVPKNIEIKEPLRFKFKAGGKSSILHNIAVIEANSRADIIEEYANDEIGSEQLNDSVTEIYANNNSNVNFYHLNNWTGNVCNFTNN